MDRKTADGSSVRTAYVFLAEGFELIEAMTPVDVLRRGGVRVATVSIGDSLSVSASNGVTVRADMMARHGMPVADALVFPGGYPGYERLCVSSVVAELAVSQIARDGIVALICGAPLLLRERDLAFGAVVTCHSSIRGRMGSFKLSEKAVVWDGNILTAAGAGCSLEFSMALLDRLTDTATVRSVREKMEMDRQI